MFQNDCTVLHYTCMLLNLQARENCVHWYEQKVTKSSTFQITDLHFNQCLSTVPFLKSLTLSLPCVFGLFSILHVLHVCVSFVYSASYFVSVCLFYSVSYFMLVYLLFIQYLTSCLCFLFI